MIMFLYLLIRLTQVSPKYSKYASSIKTIEFFAFFIILIMSFLGIDVPVGLFGFTKTISFVFLVMFFSTFSVGKGFCCIRQI